jgi:UDP-perosamine 4-acetyltransferase
MTKRVAIIGAGGHARVVFEAIESAASSDKDIEIVGFISPEDPTNLPAPWLGNDDVLKALCADKTITHFTIGLGSIAGGENLREMLFTQALEAGAAPFSAIHASAVISPRAILADGVTVMAGAIINTGAKLHENAIINTRASVDHDCTIGAHTHIAPGAVLSGNVVVGSNALVGVGATCKQGIHIGSGATIGAGAVVVSDIVENSICIGAPAKPIQTSS